MDYKAFKMRSIRNTIQKNISVSQFRAYTNHPRKKPSGFEFDAFCADIKERGILTPIKARFTLGEKNDAGEDLYEIISGHCRWEAAKVVGLEKIPAIIETVQNDNADIEVVSSNFGIKSMTPSEIGKFCKLWMDAHNRQGKRSAKGEEESTREHLAAQFGISDTKVHRYMRFAELIPEFQDAVDNNQISKGDAERISFLNEKEQKILHKITFKKGKYNLNKQQANKLKEEVKKLEEESKKDGHSRTILTKDMILEILNSVEEQIDSSSVKRPRSIKIPYKSIEKHVAAHFEDQEMTEEGVLEMIMKALDAYSIGR